MTIFLGIGVVIFFILIREANQKNISNKRLNLIKKATEELQWKLIPESTELKNIIFKFSLLHKGIELGARNFVKTDIPNGEMMMCDTEVNIGTIKRTKFLRQTVAFYSAQDVSFPNFVLEGRLDTPLKKGRTGLDYNEVDFREYPGFHDKFKIVGQDKKRIKDLFSSGLIDSLEQNPNTFGMEARDGKLYLYYLDNLCPGTAEGIKARFDHFAKFGSYLRTKALETSSQPV